jgi:hypothetical protein
MATTRTRKARGVAPQVAPTETPLELQTLAVEHYTNNSQMNACKGRAEKARKLLFAKMTDSGIKSFDLATNIDGKPVLLEAIVAPSNSRTTVDIDKLRKTVSAEDFYAIVSATAKAVVDVAGKDVLARCSTIEPGTNNVTVKPKK